MKILSVFTFVIGLIVFSFAQSPAIMLDQPQDLDVFRSNYPVDMGLRTTPTQRLDSTKSKDESGGRLTKNYYEYNSQNKVSLRDGYQWDDTDGWKLIVRYLWGYDINDNITERTQLVSWSPASNSFSNGSKWNNTYVNNQIVETVITGLNPAQVWGNSEKNVFSYDANWNQNEMITYHWDNGQWNFYSKKVSTYDQNNNIVSSTESIYMNGAWDPWHVVEYVYNSNNELVQLTGSDYSTGVLDYEYQFNYSYLPNGLLDEREMFSWENNSWEPKNKWDSDFDALLNRTQYSIYFGNGSSNWRLNSEYVYVYNNAFPYSELMETHLFNEYESRHQRLVDTFKRANLSSGEKEIELIRDYYWSEFVPTSVENPMETLQKIAVFPNPAEDYIQFELPQSGKPATVDLFNANGAFIVRRRLINDRMQLPQLSDGYYFYRIKQGQKNYSGKFLIHEY